ncbi:hypothetical protein EsH8_I_000515 [Colletotrichum jinshuiense]
MAVVPHSGRSQPQLPKSRAELSTTSRGHHTTGPPVARFPAANSAIYRLWFLEMETWSIESIGTSTCRFNLGPMRISEGLQIWTSNLTGWLRQWVKEGCNPFIHQQLYLDTGLPRCLQDAWTTLTAYFSKTPQNNHIVMKIIEDRADGLLQEQAHDDDSFMAVPGLRTVEHLARVQALFIYQYLRLHDGSIRQRALAESSIGTLLVWCAQLWQSATMDADHGMQLSKDSDQSAVYSEQTTLSHWKAWILSESVRRTWLTCHSTLAVYFRERDGWNECTGEIKFTASQGLWNAASSRAWAGLVSEREPLFVKSLHVDELLSTAMYSEVDNFSTVLMALLMGREEVDSWAAVTYESRAFS